MSMSRLEAVLTMINEQTSAANQQIDKAEQFASRTESLRVVGESRDHLAQVTVDGVGQMVDLAFGDGFARASADEVRTAVLTAHVQAKQKLTNRVREIGTEIYGSGSSAVDLVADSYESRYGSYDEEEDR